MLLLPLALQIMCSQGTLTPTGPSMVGSRGGAAQLGEGSSQPLGTPTPTQATLERKPLVAFHLLF